MMRSFGGLALACVLLAPRASWAVPPACGPDCSTPGRYVLCNDSFDTNPAGGGAVALDELEWVCSAFASPSAAPITIVGAYGLFAPSGGSNPTIFELRAYNDGPGAGPPQPQLTPSQPGNLQIPFSATPSFVQLPVSPSYTVPGAFRICLLNGFEVPDMAIAYDGDGAQALRNFTRRNGRPWEEGTASGVSGDFALRAVVDTAERGPWQPGGLCPSAPDGGVAPDASAPTADASAPNADASAPNADASAPNADASAPNADASAPNADASAPIADASAPIADAGPAAEDAATAAEDAMTPAGEDASAALDAALGPSDASGAPDAGAPAAAPTIAVISPSSGPNTQRTPVIITGTGFRAGATVRVGAIGATDVVVPGSTSLQASVPPGIVPGTYDVALLNPDGQAAILPRGFTVTGAGEPAVADDGCGCATGGASGAPWAVMLLVVLGARRRPAKRR